METTNRSSRRRRQVAPPRPLVCDAHLTVLLLDDKMSPQAVPIACVASMVRHPVTASGLVNGFVALVYAHAEQTFDLMGKPLEYPTLTLLPLGTAASPPHAHSPLILAL
jgi:hypothetical protein